MTRGAVAARPGEDITDLPTTAIWGLLRTAQNEHPNRIHITDLDHHPHTLTTLPTTLTTQLTTNEPQTAIRHGQPHTPRLTRTTTTHTLTPPNTPSWHLHTTQPGTIDNLTLTPNTTTTQPLQPGQIRITVHAAGLNFRDALMTLGMYPGPTALGGEAAGTILETAPDVHTLHPGDKVMGLFTNAIGPTAITDHRLTTTIPPNWTYQQAATTPVAFLTAYYALHHLAHAQPGEKILIHAATGGVGLAALQLAQHLNLDTYTTASPTKWPTLHAHGIPTDHIANSRTLDFEHHIRTTTNNTGIDIVLNALAHQYTDASLRLLAPGGRFIEMGKTDIRDPHHITTHHPHITYQAFDLIDAGPDHIHHMLQQLHHLFTTHTLHPLPTTNHHLHHAPHAIRELSQARHTGKLALTPTQPLNPHHTILITGGTGTLATALAHHLTTHHGARHLILASRQG
ncbi:zinc-binding dehydrogenase, partial [Nonomuraea sp. NPDC050643]|uniref:zinc-binding dehydrogenase n=1 Tax=Nonomuraea sp. NPDC050643 TaxID=3155660 RepID=UPI00340D0662